MSGFMLSSEHERLSKYNSEAGIFGATRISMEKEQGEATRINLTLVAHPDFDDTNMLYKAPWNDIFPGNVIIQCEHCHQHGATKTPCRYCGAPIP